MKIGVLGLNNVGKTYLLSKIVKVDFPTGYSIEKNE
jgi:GTPase SAR1 family protein